MNQDISIESNINLLDDERFVIALNLFNNGDWYPAHDAFEELWHENNGDERKILQGILQIAVAQVHLERGNRKGATILYGEGIGRLRSACINDFCLDLVEFIDVVQIRLEVLQNNGDIDICRVPILKVKRTFI